MNAQREKTLWENLRTYTMAQYAAQGLNFVRGMLIARVLDPAHFGIYGIMLLILQYAPYLNLGVSFAASLELSKARGRGDAESFRNIQGVTQAVTLVIYGVAALLAVLVYLVLRSVASSPYLEAGAVLGVTALLQQLQFNQINFWRASNQFARLSLSNVIASVMSVLVVLLGGHRYGMGAVYGSLVFSFGAAVVLTPGARLNWEVVWDLKLARSLMAIGTELMALNLSVLAFSSVDRVLVAGNYDAVTLGHFNFAFYVMNGASLIPLALVVVATPRILEKTGSAAGREYFKSLLDRLTHYMLLGVPIILLGFSIATQALVPGFLPKYVESVPYILPMAGVFFAMLVMKNADSYLTSIRYHRFQIVLFASGCALRALVELGIARSHGSASLLLGAAAACAWVTSSLSFWVSERQLGAQAREVFLKGAVILLKGGPMLLAAAAAIWVRVPLWVQLGLWLGYVVLLVLEIRARDRALLERALAKLHFVRATAG